MSKKKNKDMCCCCCDSGFGSGGLFDGDGCGIIIALLFWLIACGAGLLNTNSILIILLFLLYGWSGQDSCGC